MYVLFLLHFSSWDDSHIVTDNFSVNCYGSRYTFSCRKNNLQWVYCIFPRASSVHPEECENACRLSLVAVKHKSGKVIILSRWHARTLQSLQSSNTATVAVSFTTGWRGFYFVNGGENLFSSAIKLVKQCLACFSGCWEKFLSLSSWCKVHGGCACSRDSELH